MTNVIEDLDGTQPSRGGATGTDVIALAVGAVLVVAIVAGFAVISITTPTEPEGLDLEREEGAVGPPPCAAQQSPMETVYRMFELTTSGPTRFSECWTPGRAPVDPEVTSYMQARRPRTLLVEAATTHLTDGQLFSHLRMRASWSSDPPAGWLNDVPRLVVLRLQPTGVWTVDEVRAP